jgi:hypothetical protein
MTKLVLGIFAIALLCMAHIGLADAVSFHSADGNFTVEFPQQPDFKESEGKTTAGVAFKKYRWLVDQGEIAYFVNISVYAEPMKSEYDALIKRAVAATEGKLVNRQSFQMQGMTGQEIFIEISDSLAARQRFLWADSKLYQFIYVGPPGSEKGPDAETFLNSARIGE